MKSDGNDDGGLGAVTDEFYYVRHAVRTDADVLWIHFSRYHEGGHSSGDLHVMPDDPDYGFYLWLYANPPDAAEDFVDSVTVNNLRQYYKTSAEVDFCRNGREEALCLIPRYVEPPFADKFFDALFMGSIIAYITLATPFLWMNIAVGRMWQSLEKRVRQWWDKING